MPLTVLVKSCLVDWSHLDPVALAWLSGPFGFMSVLLSSAPSPTIGLVIPPTALVIAGGLVGRLNACVARVDAEIGVTCVACCDGQV